MDPGAVISLDLIASFASAARHASFAKAARELGLTPSAVAKNVARLESRLGVRLFHRTTRQVALSPDGESLYARGQRILGEIEAFEALAVDARSGPRGTLRVDLPVSYGRQVVLPVLLRLMKRYPALEVDARFSDHVVDIVREGLDAAVRVGPLADSRLVGRAFDRQRLRTYASPGYLARRRKPGTPEELSSHSCLLFRMPSSGRERHWQFRHGERDYAVVPEGAVRLGDGDALVAGAAAGLGVIQVPDYMAEADVRRGKLVEILRSYRPAPQPILLVYPGNRHCPPRVHALAAALLERRKARFTQ